MPYAATIGRQSEMRMGLRIVAIVIAIAVLVWSGVLMWQSRGYMAMIVAGVGGGLAGLALERMKGKLARGPVSHIVRRSLVRADRRP